MFYVRKYPFQFFTGFTRNFRFCGGERIAILSYGPLFSHRVYRQTKRGGEGEKNCIHSDGKPRFFFPHSSGKFDSIDSSHQNKYKKQIIDDDTATASILSSLLPFVHYHTSNSIMSTPMPPRQQGRAPLVTPRDSPDTVPNTSCRPSSTTPRSAQLPAAERTRDFR